ncbi:MAG: hypothetical protein ACJ73J_10705, partial [Actinomycetes bacterium]
MNKGSEFAAPHAAVQIFAAHHETRDQISWRIREHEKALGVTPGCGQQPFIVRVATDHPMQNDDISRLNLLRRQRDVNDPAFDAIRCACL